MFGGANVTASGPRRSSPGMDCRRDRSLRTRRRREPERGVLYAVLLGHLQTFLARADEGAGRGLPAFVRRELYRYLDCGILANGLARVHCAQCGRDASGVRSI